MSRPRGMMLVHLLIGFGLSWVCRNFLCRKKGPNDRHLFVGPTRQRHVDRHAADMPSKMLSKTTTLSNPGCRRRHVGDMIYHTIFVYHNIQVTS